MNKTYKSSAVTEMGDRSATIDMGRKVGRGLLCPFPWGELGSHLKQCCLGKGLPPYQVASWSIQPIGHNTPTSQTLQRSRSIGWTVTCNCCPKSTDPNRWPGFVLSSSTNGLPTEMALLPSCQLSDTRTMSYSTRYILTRTVPINNAHQVVLILKCIVKFGDPSFVTIDEHITFFLKARRL